MNLLQIENKSRTSTPTQKVDSFLESQFWNIHHPHWSRTIMFYLLKSSQIKLQSSQINQNSSFYFTCWYH